MTPIILKFVKITSNKDFVKINKSCIDQRVCAYTHELTGLISTYSYQHSFQNLSQDIFKYLVSHLNLILMSTLRVVAVQICLFISFDYKTHVHIYF